MPASLSWIRQFLAIQWFLLDIGNLCIPCLFFIVLPRGLSISVIFRRTAFCLITFVVFMSFILLILACFFPTFCFIWVYFCFSFSSFSREYIIDLSSFCEHLVLWISLSDSFCCVPQILICSIFIQFNVTYSFETSSLIHGLLCPCVRRISCYLSITDF